MSKKISAGLFVRLMRGSAQARNDLLEYIGEGPVAADDILRDALGLSTPLSPAAMDDFALRTPKRAAVRQ